jgi:hypothetical protein
MADRDPEIVKNIRELLGGFIGARLVDVTQHDRDYARDAASPDAEVFLHFDNGQTLHFWINEVEGFEILGGPDKDT